MQRGNTPREHAKTLSFNGGTQRAYPMKLNWVTTLGTKNLKDSSLVLFDAPVILYKSCHRHTYIHINIHYMDP